MPIGPHVLAWSVFIPFLDALIQLFKDVPVGNHHLATFEAPLGGALFGSPA